MFDEKEFDKSFRLMKKLSVAWCVVCGLASLAVMGFGVWVTVKLLQHFGVV